MVRVWLSWQRQHSGDKPKLVNEAHTAGTEASKQPAIQQMKQNRAGTLLVFTLSYVCERTQHHCRVAMVMIKTDPPAGQQEERALHEAPGTGPPGFLSPRVIPALHVASHGRHGQVQPHHTVAHGQSRNKHASGFAPCLSPMMKAVTQSQAGQVAKYGRQCQQENQSPLGGGS